MRRNNPYLRAGGATQSRRLRTREITQAIHCRIPMPSQTPELRILSMDRWRPNLEDSVDEMLSSALVAQDKELAHLLQEVEKVSKSLKSDAPDTQALSNTLQRTLLCAVKHSLLDRELRALCPFGKHFSFFFSSCSFVASCA